MTPEELQQEVYRIQWLIKKFKRQDDFYFAENHEAELNILLNENGYSSLEDYLSKHGQQ